MGLLETVRMKLDDLKTHSQMLALRLNTCMPGGSTSHKAGCQKGQCPVADNIVQQMQPGKQDVVGSQSGSKDGSARLHHTICGQRTLHNLQESQQPRSHKHRPCQPKVCDFGTEAVQAGVGGGQHHVAAAQVLQQGPAQYKVACMEGRQTPTYRTDHVQPRQTS